MDDVILTFLGTGAAIPPENRFQSSFALRHPHGLVLFDIGEGTQFNLRKFKVPIKKELTIAISHMHADHYQGLSGVIASLNLLKREDPVNILFPEIGEDFLKLLLFATKVNTEYQINWVPMKPGTIFSGKKYSITATRALHFKNSLSYLWKENAREGKWNTEILEKHNLENKQKAKIARGESVTVNGLILKPTDIIGSPREGRSVVYSGDTRYNPELIDFALNCDALVHEATYPYEMSTIANEREHSTTEDAAKIGKLANAETVILTHIGTRIINLQKEKEYLKKIRAVIFAYDGFKHVLKFKN